MTNETINKAMTIRLDIDQLRPIPFCRHPATAERGQRGPRPPERLGTSPELTPRWSGVSPGAAHVRTHPATVSGGWHFVRQAHRCLQGSRIGRAFQVMIDNFLTPLSPSTPAISRSPTGDCQAARIDGVLPHQENILKRRSMKTRPSSWSPGHPLGLFRSVPKRLALSSPTAS